MNATHAAARAAALIAAATLAPAAAAQSEYTWTGAGADQLWNNQDNWLNDTLGSIISGFPTLSDIANFTADATTEDGAAATINIQPLTTLTLGFTNQSSTQLAGTLNNLGTLAFNTDNTDNDAFDIDTRIQVNDRGLTPDTTLTGDGTVLLNGSETGFRGNSKDAATIRNDQHHTIQGNGGFQSLTLINEGLLNATNGDIFLNNAVITGTGTVRLEPNTTLRLDNSSAIDSVTLNAIGGPGAATVPTLAGSGNASINDNLTISGSLVLGENNTNNLNAAGTLTNNAGITFLADDTDNDAFDIDNRIRVFDQGQPTDFTLTGNGSITLNGTETGFQGNSSTTATLLHDQDHTINGAGTFQSINIINQGVIAGFLGDLNLISANLEGNGEIRLQAGTTLFADANSSIAGNTLRADPNAALDGQNGATLRDITLRDAPRFGADDRSSFDIQGTITNNAGARFNPDNTDDDAFDIDNRLRVLDQGLPVDATLTGNGELALDGNETGIQGNSALAATLLHEQDHAITGSGTIQNIHLENLGEIVPDDGTIRLASANITGPGAIIIRQDATLSVNASSSVSNNTITGFVRSAIDGDVGATLVDNTLQGEIGLGTDEQSSLDLQGTLTNNAETLFVFDDTDNDAFDLDNRLRVLDQGLPTDATLAGNGTLTTNGPETGIQGNSPVSATLLHAAPHTIAGSGAIQSINLINQGTINPGDDNFDPTETLTLNTAELDNTNGTLAFDLASTDPDDADTIAYNNRPLDLAGTIKVNLLDTFEPALGDRFLIITGNRDALGFFDTRSFPQPADPDAFWRIDYQPSSVTLTLTCFADANADNAVDLGDLLAVLANFATATTAGPAQGDLDESGTVDLNDLLAVLSAFGSTCP